MRRIIVGMVTMLLSASVALAQASPPVEGAPANTPGATDDTGSAWWLIVVVVVAIAAIWFFARRRNRT
jgi:LPXTG-motif cell wall-anchored protein